MNASKWEYGGYSNKYDMTGDIHVGTGIVRVHDIFDRLPDFMKEADLIFSDPPYNKSALSSYYTKANLDKRGTFDDFYYRFLECLDIIKPKTVCMEVGLAQTDMWVSGLEDIGYKVRCIKESYYYGNKKNKCNIILAGDVSDTLMNLSFMDEEKVIEYIIQKADFSCIGDLCMGKGLVGYYANKHGKRFVGTELNKKRLAVCVERVSTGERGKIN